MRKRTSRMLIVLGFMLANVIWISAEGVVHAEEFEPAGYHEYITTEDEAIDQWYGIARGTYLKSGVCSITRAGTAKMSVSGTTTAHQVCDTVKVSVYLNESLDGGSSYGTIGSYYFSESNTSSCHGSKGDIPVTSGRYYYVSAGHSAAKESTTEMTSTHTNAIKAS